MRRLTKATLVASAMMTAAATRVGAISLESGPEPGTRTLLVVIIAALGVAGLIWVGWSTLRGAVVRGRVVGYERREGPDGLLDHPIIEYINSEGVTARLTSTFGAGISQRSAPWPMGSTATVRIDWQRARHHAPMIKVLFLVIATSFLIAFVLAVA